MKGCGFHQSDAAHHLHWGLCGLGSGVQWVGCCSSLPVRLLSLRPQLAWEVRAWLHQRGRCQGRSDSREPDRDWVRWFCCLLLVSVELRVAMAGVTQQWVAKSLARGCVGDQVLRRALDELLTAVCQCVCRAGSSHVIRLCLPGSLPLLVDGQGCGSQ